MTSNAGVNVLSELQKDEELDVAQVAQVSDLVECGLLLHPAPATVSLLGQLIVHSSKVDVSLESAKPTTGWLYVKNPNSLRASLLQIGNSSWEAFRMAHRNMDTIQLTMALVPTHLEASMKLVKKDTSPKLLKTLLPKNFERITKAAQKCQDAAKETEKCFDGVIKLIDEISESVATTEGLHERQQRENEGKLKGMEKSQANLNKLTEMAKKEYDAVKEEVRTTRKLYKKAANDIPTGWNKLAMEVVGGLGQAVTTVAQTAGKTMSGLAHVVALQNAASMVMGSMSSTSGEGKKEKKKERKEEILLVNNDPLWDAEKQALLLNMQSMFNENFIESAKKFASLQGEFKVMLKLEKDPSVRKLLEGAISVVGEIETHTTCMKDMDEKDKRIINLQIETLVQEGTRLATSCASANDSVDGGKKKNSKKGHDEQANSNEIFMVNLRRQEVRDAEQKLEGSFDKYAKMMKDLSEVEKEMAELDVTRLNLQDIRDMLRKVIGILGQIKEHWSQLVLFFSKVAVRTEALNQEIIFPALEDATTIAEEADGIDKEMLIELLSEQSVKINGACYFLHMVANTYVKVSEKFILGKLAGLAKLLGAEDDNERNRLLGEIQTNAREAKKGIAAIVEQQHQDYRREIKNQALMIEEQASTLIIEELP